MTEEKILGVMFDPARTVFRHEWYRKFLPDLARWGYNTMMLNLADDLSCTIELHRRPELASPHAFSQDEMRRLIDEAAKHNIQVIPFMPSFGHTGYIHRRKPYQHLRNGVGRAFLCPAHPETYQVLTDVWEEIMELFPAPWVHAGLDEFGQVPDPNCPLCQKEFADIPKWQVYVKHVTWLHDLFAEHGKRMMIWNEFPEGPWKQSQVADSLPKDIVLTLENDDPEKTQFYLKHGFDLIRCFPYLISYPGTTVLPHAGNLNFQPWSVDLEAYRSRILGTISPVWQSTYVLFGTMMYAIAYAADWHQNSGGSEGFSTRSCEGYFRVSDGRTLGDLLARFHREAPVFSEFGLDENRLFTRITRAGHLINLFSHEDANQLTADEIAYGSQLARQAEEIAQGLRKERPQVKRNVKVLDAYILAADIVRHIGLRGELMAGISRDLRAAEEAAQAGEGRKARRLRLSIRNGLRKAAAESRKLTEQAFRNFDWGYYPDHPAKHPVLPPDSEENLWVDIDRLWYFDGGNGNIFASLKYSTQYLEKLAREAEGLVQSKRAMAGLGPIPCAVPPQLPVTEFVQNWQISEALPSPGDLSDFPYPGDSKALGLQPRQFTEGWCDLREDLFASAPNDVLVYLSCRIDCPEPMPLSACLGYDGPVKVWIDGREAFCDPAGTRPIGIDKVKIPFEASAGQQEVLIALCSDYGQAWGMRLRFLRRDLPPELLEKGPGAYLLPHIGL